MKVDTTLIERLSKLAKLQFDEGQKEELKVDLEKIIGFFEKISELDTDNVEPLIYMNENGAEGREDKVVSLTSREKALKNVPSQDGTYIQVPKMIQKGS